MIDYFDDNPFETDEDYFLKSLINESYKFCIMI